jgi:hypothetical protein
MAGLVTYLTRARNLADTRWEGCAVADACVLQSLVLNHLFLALRPPDPGTSLLARRLWALNGYKRLQTVANAHKRLQTGAGAKEDRRGETREESRQDRQGDRGTPSCTHHKSQVDGVEPNTAKLQPWASTTKR